MTSEFDREAAAAREIAPPHSGERHWPTPEERRRILRQAYRLRAAAGARAFAWPARALARLARRAAAAIASTRPGKRAELAACTAGSSRPRDPS